jgi:hypothetical protein
MEVAFPSLTDSGWTLTGGVGPRRIPLGKSETFRYLPVIFSEIRIPAFRKRGIRVGSAMNADRAVSFCV